MRYHALIFSLAISVFACTHGTLTAVGQTVESFKSEREALVDLFRRTGQLDWHRLSDLERRLTTLPNLHASATALFELSTVLRFQSRFSEAVASYERTIEVAVDDGQTEIAFDAWIGLARSYRAEGLDHGAALAAIDRARAIAGATPTDRQAFDLASFGTQLATERGELNLALVNALRASRLALDDVSEFYAALDLGDVFQKFAERCDFFPIQDALSQGPDGHDACRRAVDAAAAAYDKARSVATVAQWRFLAGQAQQFGAQLALRRGLIDMRASQTTDTLLRDAFSHDHAEDVLVSDRFETGASTLGGFGAIAQMAERVASEADSTNPRSIYLKGLAADMRGDEYAAALHFSNSVSALEAERSSLFDLRRRGTVVEDRPELIRSLALRLLQRGENDAAFRVFEINRARGQRQLGAGIAQADLTSSELHWLAELAERESRRSALSALVVARAIAGLDQDETFARIAEFDVVEYERRALIEAPRFADTLSRISTIEAPSISLSALRQTVLETQIPVISYWVTPSNVVVWALSPDQEDVAAVFLPEQVLVEKVQTLQRSLQDETIPFDQQIARSLYAFLLGNFEDHLTSDQVMIIPQGPLSELPFEALINPKTDQYFVQEQAVSYAPSATWAATAMTQTDVRPTDVRAVYDPSVNRLTGEIERIEQSADIRVEALPSNDMTQDVALSALSGADVLHVLLHGVYETDDPLQSHLRLNEIVGSAGDRIRAADLLAVDWSKTRLAVMSACEGAALEVRLSNELFGLSWGPLVGGVDALLMSRWRVRADSNAVWMETFYQSLSEGGSSAQASATAMRKMLEGDWADPYYWAGPKLFGK